MPTLSVAGTRQIFVTIFLLEIRSARLKKAYTPLTAQSEENDSSIKSSKHEAGLNNAARLVNLQAGVAKNEARRGIGSVND